MVRTSWQSVNLTSCGLPRPRGDGPRMGEMSYCGQERSPPPTRGWSLAMATACDATGRRLPRPRGDGPRIPGGAVLDSSQSLPRPRGDGPKRYSGFELPPTRGWPGPSRGGAWASPPPTRGWSGKICSARTSAPAGVSPAHAGMVLYQLAPTSGMPLTVSPAHAGMVPDGPAPGLSTRSRLPRPRGDGPHDGLTARRLRMPTVSPAHAGMVPFEAT